MFRIPSFYKMEMTFEQAKATISFAGDLLKGMEDLSDHWDKYATGKLDHLYKDDDEFFEHWQYEVNAYNKVFSTFQPLFS